MVDMVADSADEVTPIYGRLPGLQQAAFLSPEVGPVHLFTPEVGPVPLFSPASDASTHFSPAPASDRLRAAAAAALSQSLFSSEDGAARRNHTPKTPNVSRLAIERCIALASQSPVSSPSPGLTRSALPGGPGPGPSPVPGPSLSQSPGPYQSPGLVLSALPDNPGPSPVPGPSALPGGLSPGPVLSAAPAAFCSPVSAPGCALRWPAGSYGLDSDEGDSDGQDPADPAGPADPADPADSADPAGPADPADPADTEGCSQNDPEGCSQNQQEPDALPPDEQSSGHCRPDRTQSIEERWPDRGLHTASTSRWRDRGLHTASVSGRRAAAEVCRRRQEQRSRQTRYQDGQRRRNRETECHYVHCVAQESGGSETRHQLSLLSRLRQLLNQLKNQLDDDGESITAARLRELKNRLRPCSASLTSLLSGHMTKEVSRRLAMVQEVSNTLLLRMKMLETRCPSAREDSSQTHIRPTAGGGAIRKRGEHRPRQTKPFACDRRKKVAPPNLPSLDPPTPESSPQLPSPGSPFVPSDDEADTPKGDCAQAASAILTRPAAPAAAPAVAPIVAPAIAPAVAPVPAAATTAAAVAPVAGALPALPAGTGPWFWPQWPVGFSAGYPAWPPPPPWFGQMAWERQPPPVPGPTTSTSPPGAAVPAVGSQPPVEQSDGAAQKLVSQHSAEQRDTQAVAASDCGRSRLPACDDEVAAAAGCRSLLLRLRTVRLVDDCELLPLSRACWDRPETLLQCGDGCWD